MGRKKDDEIFIQLPTADNRGKATRCFGPVDLNRLRSDTKAMRRVSIPNLVSTFQPAADIDLLTLLGESKETINLSNLTQSLTELLGQIEQLLLQYGESGQKIWDTIKVIQDLSTVFTSIAEGNFDKAEDNLKDIFYSLLSQSGNLAGHLKKIEEAAQSKDIAYEVLESSDGYHQALYLEWSGAIKRLTKAVSELETIEKDYFQPAIRRISDFRSDFGEFLRNTHPVIISTVRELEESDDCFNFLALQFLRSDSIPYQDIEGKLLQTKGLITQCRTLEQECQGNWQELSRYIKEEVLIWQEELTNAQKELTASQRKIREIKQKLPPKSPPPSEIYGLVEGNEYQQAETILQDVYWEAHNVRDRLDSKLNGLLQFTHSTTEPQLPPEVEAMITRTEKLLREINKKLISVVEQPLSLSRPTSPLKETTPVSETDQSRIQELYELVICIGYELTCSEHFFAASTIKSMLKVLFYLNFCSEEEITKYCPLIIQCSQLPEERELIDQGKSTVQERWNNSQITWIAYKRGRPNPRLYYLKLTKQAGVKTQQLFTKYNLTREQIRSAYQQKQAAERRAYQEKKKA